MYHAGTAYLTVVPSFEGIEGALKREAENIGRHVDRTIAQTLPQGIREGLRRADRDMDAAGRRAGDRYGGAFADTMNQRLSKAAKAFSTVEIKADSTDAERKIADVRKDILELRDAHANLDIDAEFAMLELRRIIAKLQEIQGEANSLEVNFNIVSALAELGALDQAAERIGTHAGDQFADHFTREVRARLAATRGKFAEVEIGADSTELERDIAAINTILGEVDDHLRVEIDINETAVLFNLELVEQKLRELAHQSPSVRIRTNALAVLAEVEAVTNKFRQQELELNRAHQQANEENERRDREHLRMLRDAYDEDDRRTRDHQRLVREAYDENERRDRDAARRLREMHDEIDRWDRDQRTRRQGTFGNDAERRLNRARDAVADITPRLQTTQTMREMAWLRAELDRLSKVTIDVDMPTNEFLRQVARVEAWLEGIERNEVDVPIRADARAALAEIRGITGFSRAQGRQAGDEWGSAWVRQIRQSVREAAASISDIDIGVNTTRAQFEIGELRARLLTLGNVRIGVDMTLGEFMREASTIQAELTRLSTQTVDVQAKVEIAGALAKLKALHEQINAVDRDDIEVDVDVNSAAASLGLLAQNAGVSMGRLGALIALGAALGTALVPAAAAAAAAIGAIGVAAGAAVAGVGVLALGLFSSIKAVTALQKAQDDQAKSARNLSQTQARVSGALDQVAGATSNVRTAERGLIRAQKDAKESVLELVKAREAAKRQLEDMALSLESNSLAQRQARLDEAEAKRNLDKILSNTSSTEEEREQAKITYEQQVLQIKQLGIERQRLTKDKAEADRKGIEGSDQVKAAQERIAASMERVVSAQEQEADSQRSLAAANRSLQQAYEQTGVAGGEAMRDLTASMDALSPAGRKFALFIFGLKDEFKLLQRAAEETLLPGLQRGIEALLPALKPVAFFIARVGEALGDGFEWAAKSLRDPTWVRFGTYMSEVVGPTIEGIFEVFMNLSKGIAGVILGLSGFTGPIGWGVLEWSQEFAKWGSTLDSNKGWQKFIAYVRESWPEVRDFFSGLWEFTKRFIAAAAPIGERVVGWFASLFEWMNKLDKGTWTILIGAIGGAAGALLVAAGITSLIAGGWVTLAVVVIAGLVAGLVWLYQNIKPVRDIMEQTWRAIVDGWNYLWNDVIKPGIPPFVALMKEAFQNIAKSWDLAWNEGIKPGFGLMVDGFKLVGSIIAALHREILRPFFDFIKAVFSTIGTIFEVFTPAAQRLAQFVGPAIDNIKMSFSFLGDVVMWIWEHIIKPVFDLFVIALKVLWAVAQVILGLFQIALKIFAQLFMGFYHAYIKPFFDVMRPLLEWLGKVITDHVLPPFRKGMEALGQAWDILVERAKKPIRFMVETVLNNGLLAGYNKLATFFKVTPNDVHIDLPQGFKAGGAIHGPGTPTSDSIPALLSTGEHVWTAREVDAVGGHAGVYALRRMARQGLLPAFKDGGPVDDDGWFARIKRTAGNVFDGIKGFFSNPVESLKKLFAKLTDQIPDKDADAVRVMAGLPKRALELALEKVTSIFNIGDSGGGAGNWPSSPMAQRGDSGVWRSVVALINSTGPISGEFGNSYRPGDPLWHGSGRAVDWMGYNQDALATFLAARKPLELIHRTRLRDYAYTRGVDKGSFNEQLMREHENHIHVAFDQGGWLQPGYSMVWNGTGVPEPVLTNRQWADMSAVARTGGAGNTYNVEFKDTTLTPSKLRAMQDADAVYQRMGRPR